MIAVGFTRYILNYSVSFQVIFYCRCPNILVILNSVTVLTSGSSPRLFLFALSLHSVLCFSSFVCMCVS